MDKYMLRAIELALDNVEDGGTPYGSVVVHNDEIIGEGVNTMHREIDVSGHAEMIAIREAQAKLGRIDLSDCVIYASGHPCPMCLSAIAIAKIPTVYFANTVEESTDAGIPIAGKIYNFLKGDMTALDLKIEHTPIVDDIEDPMKKFKNK